MAAFANKLGADMMQAQSASAPPHGTDIARVTPQERAGYVKALTDAIDYLEAQARAESDGIVAAGLRVAAREVAVYRSGKLARVPQ